MRGRHPGPGAVHVPDHLIVPIVEHALKTFLFRVGDKVLRQKRGAGMGDLFSVALCILSVMERERELNQSLQMSSAMDKRSWICLRYVDNQLILACNCPNEKSNLPSKLRSHEFYGPPVLLEDEPGMEYLGMRLHICGKGIEIECEVHGFDCLISEDEREVSEFEHERWRYRTMRSAGTNWSIVSGMAARLHNAVRMAYPKWRAQVAVLKLFGICAFLQYPYRPVMQLMQKHSKQYPKVYTSQVQGCIVDAFHHDANLRMIACMIKSMGG